jgi:hypothetical protein
VNDVYDTPLPAVSPVKKPLFLHLYRGVNTAREIFLENFLGENENPQLKGGNSVLKIFSKIV